ncbi:transcriptional regulator Nrg1, partial [Dioszegia hungarica]
PPPTSKGKNGATGPAEGKAKPHLCHICGRGFTTGGHLQRHQRIHTGVKAFRCPYPGCDTKTSRQDNLQQHYRTHLSPELRRGDGSQARAAVNAAMEAAGMKSVSTRQPRKSKASNAGTPSSASATGSTSHLPSPYQTPTSQGPSPYAPYMFDPTQHGYPAYPLPPPIQMLQPHPQQSVNSSRAPSPTSAHHPQAAGPGPGTINPNQHPHQHQFYPQPFPPYGYPTAMPPQAYRHFAGMTNPYAPPHPHHPMYSPGGRPVEEAGPPPQFYGHHLYSPMQPNFGHSREGSYGGMMTPGYAQGPMANGNGYPPR